VNEAVELIELPTALPQPGGAETILVVEDEDIVRNVVVSKLKKNGYEVLTAANGPEALDLVERYPRGIHLMITDVVMPQMNGRELAEAAAPKRPDMAILYMSGYPQDVITHRGILEQGVAFIEKSMLAAHLLDKIRAILNQHAPHVIDSDRPLFKEAH